MMECGSTAYCCQAIVTHESWSKESIKFGDFLTNTLLQNCFYRSQSGWTIMKSRFATTTTKRWWLQCPRKFKFLIILIIWHSNGHTQSNDANFTVFSYCPVSNFKMVSSWSCPSTVYTVGHMSNNRIVYAIYYYCPSV